MVTNLLNPENRSLENVSIVPFKEIFDIPLLNKLFISFLNLFISLNELNNTHKYIYSKKTGVNLK